MTKNMTSILLFALTLSISFTTNALDLGIGLFRPEEKVQTSSGSEKPDPMSPNISVGHLWKFDSFDFAPRFGYIRNQKNSEDSYGTYQVETLYLLYDLSQELHVFNSGNMRWSYGIGTFAKRIKGEGGWVTVPNGSGTATAARPGETKTSYTLSAETGLDYRWRADVGNVTSYGLQGYLYALQPLNNKKRLFALSLQFLVEF